MPFTVSIARQFAKETGVRMEKKRPFTESNFRWSFWKPLVCASSMVFIRVMHSSKPAQGNAVDSCQFRGVWRCLVQLGSSTVKDCRAGAASPFPWTLSPLLPASPSADGLKGAIWPWRWGSLPCQQASEPIWRCVSLDWKIFPIRKVD